MLAVGALHVLEPSLAPTRHAISEYLNTESGAVMVLALAVWAASLVLSPRLEVGSSIRRRKDIDEPEPQDGYVVDVSVQGVKVKLESDVTGRFTHDGEMIPYHEADRVSKSPAPSRCARRSQNAGQSTGTACGIATRTA